MSNLNLPTLTYGALAATIRGDRPTTIAYATRARHLGPNVALEHHGTRVAVLAPQFVAITTAGYGTRTTTARLHRVLKDNGIPWSVAIRNGYAVLLDADLQVERALGSDVATFTRTRGVWALEPLTA